MIVIPMHLCVLLYTFNVIRRAINIVFSVTLVLKSHFMWIRIHDDDDDDDDDNIRPDLTSPSVAVDTIEEFEKKLDSN